MPSWIARGSIRDPRCPFHRWGILIYIGAFGQDTLGNEPAIDAAVQTKQPVEQHSWADLRRDRRDVDPQLQVFPGAFRVRVSRRLR